MKIINIITVLIINLIIVGGYIDSWLKYSSPTGYENRSKKVYAVMTISYLVLLIWFNFWVIR